MNESVEPLGRRILIRKDESRQKTKGGIVLPDKAEIPTITGRVVEVSAQIERDIDFPVQKYDKVLFHPKNAIPVDFEPDNVLFVVPIEDVVAVFRKVGKPRPRRAAKDDDEVDEPGDASHLDDDLDE
ncbi:MAG: co-chaperone GroES [Planctomycetes bacterium]|nr:co-chaperone GroES [Planctomycetota bacterium]